MGNRRRRTAVGDRRYNLSPAQHGEARYRRTCRRTQPLYRCDLRRGSNPLRRPGQQDGGAGPRPPRLRRARIHLQRPPRPFAQRRRPPHPCQFLRDNSNPAGVTPFRLLVCLVDPRSYRFNPWCECKLRPLRCFRRYQGSGPIGPSLNDGGDENNLHFPATRCGDLPEQGSFSSCTCQPCFPLST